jgi:hypothetical protein
VAVCKINDELVIYKGFRYNNLYLVDFSSKDTNIRTCLFIKAYLGWLWHRRLAHVGIEYTQEDFEERHGYRFERCCI